AVSFSGFGELVSCDANAAGASCSLLVANKPTTPPPPETPKYPFGFTKVDEQGGPLAGAEFQLKDSAGKVVATVASGSDGKVSFPAVKPGKYTVTESKAPAGYEKVADFTVTIADDGTVTGLPAGNKVVDEKTPPEYPFGFTKVDENGNPLAGAEFQLKDASGKVIATVTSGTDGKVTFPSVAPGIYTVTESKAPQGYEKVADFTVTIADDGTITGLPTDGKVVDKPATPPEYPFGFTKVDENGNPLAGAEFQLKDASGNVVATVTSGADGKVSFPSVAPGIYTVTESKAPEGYEKVADFTVTIADDGTATGLPADGKVVDKPTTPPPPTTPPTT
ncbi:cna protein B-type domain, partial [Bifidobacterium sp. DSM 109958]